MYAALRGCLVLTCLTTACARHNEIPATPSQPDDVTIEPDAAAPVDSRDAARADAAPLSNADAGRDGAASQIVDLTLTSPAFAQDGTLPVDYTCDGLGKSPPLAWTDPPAGTTELTLLMTTEARDGLKWNWVLYRIAASARSLREDDATVGMAGLTSDGPELAYSPPCSQGPGAKAYTFTLYALSQPLELAADPSKVTGAAVSMAMSGLVLASSELTVSYTRP